jgi:hypothetical protein
VIVLWVSALTHNTAQSFGMTDTQIFAFLVMPFLSALTCSMVFVSSRTTKPKKSADPPKPVIRPNAYMRKSCKRSTSVRQTDAIED